MLVNDNWMLIVDFIFLLFRHVDQAVLDESITKAAISDGDALNVTEVSSVSINKTSDLTLVAADSSTCTNLDIKPDVIPTTDLPSTVPEIIPTEVVPLKNTGLLDSNKPGQFLKHLPLQKSFELYRE